MGAENIYNIQNKIIHAGLASIGMPYSENKDVWTTIAGTIAKRKVESLSELNLRERRSFIKHLEGNGAKITYNPFVPGKLTFWKKGNPEPEVNDVSRPVKTGRGNRRLISKVHAILADLKLPWSYADGICKSRFKVDRVEWLETPELIKLVQMLVIHQKRQEKKA
jgi:hypothetical protein